MVSRVFVTGGSGLIGTRLIGRLLKDGFHVNALARTRRSMKLLSALGVQVIEGDVLDMASLEKGIQDCDAIFHLAGLVSFRFVDKKRMFQVNVLGTRNILRLVEKYHVAKFIYCSSTAALGKSGDIALDETHQRDPKYFSTYEETKSIAHSEVLEASKRLPGIVIAMPSFVMGAGATDILGNHIKAFCRGFLPFFVNIDTMISYVYADDVAEGLFLCLKKGHSGEQYIFSADSCTPLQLVSLLEKYSGRKGPRLHLNPMLAKPILFLDEIVETLIGRHPLLTLELLGKLHSKKWVYSGQKARSRLGWAPQNLENMVKETVGAI